MNEPGFSPTPSPDRLAEVLEPGGHAAAHTSPRITKRVVAIVLAGALVLGLVFASVAAWLFR